MLRRFAAANMLTMAVGGALIGATPAMATTPHDNPKHAVHKSLKAHKKSDDDKFSSKASQTQYCIILIDSVIINGRVMSPDHAKRPCDQSLWQENEGDENEIGEA